MSASRRLTATLLVFAPITFTSCLYRTKAVAPPSVNASAAGSGAMELYDTNGDGKIAGDELNKAVSLKAALKRLDTNGDGAVDADEVAARVNAWKTSNVALTSMIGRITLDGEPTPGITMTLEPEPFLGDEVKKATGVSNIFGDVAPQIAKEDRPDPTLPGGVHHGLYKVRFSLQKDGKELLPVHYNTETTIGFEVSPDNPDAQKRTVFDLKTK